MSTISRNTYNHGYLPGGPGGPLGPSGPGTPPAKLEKESKRFAQADTFVSGMVFVGQID